MHIPSRSYISTDYYYLEIPHPGNENDILTLCYETPESLYNLYNLSYSKYINQITSSISSDYNFYIQPC